MEPVETIKPAETTPCACSTSPLMTVEAAATAVTASEEYLYSGLREGRFPGKRLGRGWRMDRDFILSFLASPAGTRFEDFATLWLARASEGMAS